MLGRNFDITNGRAACEASSATWSLGTNSAFALGSRFAATSRYIDSARTADKTPLPTVLPLLRHVAIARTTQRRPLNSYSIVVMNLLWPLPSNGNWL
jgi:hypothetical protein